MLTLTLTSYLSAQQIDDHCGTPDDTLGDPIGAYSASIDPAYLASFEPVVYNVFVWGVNKPDGTNHFPDRANDALAAVAQLNILYNQFNIFFKYRGFEEFDSPVIQGDSNGHYVLQTIGEYGQLRNWAASNGYFKTDAFNIYAYGWSLGYGGIGNPRGLDVGVASASLTRVTLVHEIAHNFVLWHTRSNNSESGEHTTRDPLDPDRFNADVAGDKVVDTAANSGFYGGVCECYPYLDQVNCAYTGTEADYYGDPYQIFHEDIINAMSDAYPCSTLYRKLTVGQGIRARESIELGYYDAALTTVASLYEPYKGEYYVSGPYPNGADVPLFQPGFEYKFIECNCNCPAPTPYEDISFSYNAANVVLSIEKDEPDYNSITHPNHTAIGIKHISLDNTFWPQPRRCYDNWAHDAKDGSVTKFNDGIFNANITITPLDSLGINSPSLIQNLNNGLYKIEKNYIDGATQETVIVKENN